MVRKEVIEELASGGMSITFPFVRISLVDSLLQKHLAAKQQRKAFAGTYWYLQQYSKSQSKTASSS